MENMIPKVLSKVQMTKLSQSIVANVSDTEDMHSEI